MTLKKSLKAEISADGPLRLDQYIERCLWDEDEGYYRRAEVFGRAGDFVTSPEISQIFGEVIGIWALRAWHELGAPSEFALLEMGAGRGLLMRDLLRVAKMDAEFMRAMRLHILEKSPARRDEQRAAIDVPITFLDDLSLPAMPLIALSNEFFDALPIRQFRNEGGGWLEAYVSADLAKIWQPCPRPPKALSAYLDQNGTIEIFEDAGHIARALGAHAGRFGGQILTIDYGDFDGIGDTFQAVENHKISDPFTNPGHADLTAHVRFRDLAEAAALDCNFMTQAQFLDAHGGPARLQNLTQSNPALAGDLENRYHRLTDQTQMGTLFKVLIQRAKHDPTNPS